MSITVKVIEVPLSQRTAAPSTAAAASTAASKSKKGKAAGSGGGTGSGAVIVISPDEEYEIAISSLNELMRLIVCLCVDNVSFQKSMFSGAKSSILLKLCQLPVRYISNELYKVHLLPALAVLCLNSSSNYGLYKREMSPVVITEYFSQSQAFIASVESANTASQPLCGDAAPLSVGVGVDDVNDKRRVMAELTRRIPMEFWPAIMEHFSR